MSADTYKCGMKWIIVKMLVFQNILVYWVLFIMTHHKHDQILCFAVNETMSPHLGHASYFCGS